MTEIEKIEMLEEIMDMEKGTLSPESILTDLKEWDSVSIISFISFIDDEFNKTIKASQVKEIKTVKDALLVMEN